MGRGVPPTSANAVKARRTTSSTAPGWSGCRPASMAPSRRSRCRRRSSPRVAPPGRGHASTPISSGAVITVPAYFDERTPATKRRRARRARGAAPAQQTDGRGHGLRPRQCEEGLYAVYDLGRGTFDFSLLRLTRGVFQVWRPAATPRWAATTSTRPSPTALEERRRLGRTAAEGRAALRGAPVRGGAIGPRRGRVRPLAGAPSC